MVVGERYDLSVPQREFVVVFAAEHVRTAESVAELDSLYRRNSEHQPGYYVFQTVHHRGADARWHSNGRAFNNAANAVELLPR